MPDYASALDELGRLGVIDDEFAREFGNIAVFRNILVHGYLDVDLDLLHRLLHEGLDDFASFAARTEAYLESL